MATYTSLRLGSKGDDVKKLQETLNKNGANIKVDGSYGQETESAVKAYQKSKGLTVDGNAGNETQTSLYGPLSTVTPSSVLTDVQKKTQAYENLKAQAPTQKTTVSQADLFAMREKVLNPDKFSYNPATDPLFISYADQARKNARLAMEDAMGQAAALSGGFGNSYAQTVGQQVYNDHMESLDAKAVDFYNDAYAKYQDKLNTDRDNLEMLSDIEANEYARYLSELDVHNTNLDRAYQELVNAENKEISEKQLEAEKEIAAAENQLEYDKWKEEFDAKNTQWETELEQKEKKEARDTLTELISTNIEDVNDPDAYYAQRDALAKYLGIDIGEDAVDIDDIESDGSVDTANSGNVQSFINNNMSYDDYMKNGYTASYFDMIKSRMQAEYDGGRLTEGDVKFLLNYYGLI